MKKNRDIQDFMVPFTHKIRLKHGIYEKTYIPIRNSLGLFAEILMKSCTPLKRREGYLETKEEWKYFEMF